MNAGEAVGKGAIFIKFKSKIAGYKASGGWHNIHLVSFETKKKSSFNDYAVALGLAAKEMLKGVVDISLRYGLPRYEYYIDLGE